VCVSVCVRGGGGSVAHSTNFKLIRKDGCRRVAFETCMRFSAGLTFLEFRWLGFIACAVLSFLAPILTGFVR